MKHHLVRLDRIAGELNVWLLAIAIGLGMLDMTVLIAKCLPPLPRPPAAGRSQRGWSGRRWGAISFLAIP
jgi:hypothetical protein